MDIDKGRGRSPDAEHGASLSPTTDRPRDKSLTSSVRSSRSDITVVADRSDSDVSFKKRSPRRTKTQVQIVEPKVSRWILFLGVFLGTEWASRRIKYNIRNEYDSEGENDSDNESIESTNDDYIQMVKVVTTGAEVEGRCLFDTGCAQGNIVSVEFAERLGFTPADFKQLRIEERFGGTSATGHRVEPLGVLKLTWYHKRSVKMFRNMRFIVTSNTNYEMVIGSSSLKKHDLVAPPNFENSVDTIPPPNAIRMRNLVNDKEGEGLQKAEQDLENQLLSLKKKKPGPSAPQKRRDNYEAAKATLMSRYRVAQKELELYEKKNLLKQNPKDLSLITRIEKLKQDLEAGDKKEDGKKEGGKKEDGKKEDNSQKSDNTLAPWSSPEIDITVSEPSGKARAPTSLDVVPPKGGIRNRK